MSEPAKNAEPTMEDILASIRRIIADDDPVKPKSGQAKVADSSTNAPPASAAKLAPAPVVPPASSEPPTMSMDRDDENGDAEIAAFEDEMQNNSDEPSEVLELTEAMRAHSPAYSGAPDVEFSEPETREFSRERSAAEKPRPIVPPPSNRRLVSPRTAAAVDSAFNSLAHTVLVQNARTLEDLVREMLKPMLKNWLDDNLPTMVERLVRAEIERVSRGRE